VAELKESYPGNEEWSVAVHPLLTHAVVRRTREIGIRMSLGARRGDDPATSRP